MKKSILIAFIVSSICTYAQTTAKSDKKNSCDNLQLWIYQDKASDTVTYEYLTKWTGALYAVSSDLSITTHTETLSYEMSINNEEKIITAPPFSHFKNQTLKKQGGTITITNCKVKCWGAETKPKEYNSLVSKTVFYVLPAKK